MKYSISTFLWTAAFNESNLALLAQLKEHGCDGVEIARFDYNDFPATKIRRELERTELECTMCFGLSGEYSLIDDDSRVRQKTLRRIWRNLASTPEAIAYEGLAFLKQHAKGCV
ncbi:hypothetical protein [Allocoleopsis sp.]|uniref:hypothetical protein n=1 Tax=Allocoleopsis sp. TaxID=3088169 RepID=UPI002FD0EC12